MAGLLSQLAGPVQPAPASPAPTDAGDASPAPVGETIFDRSFGRVVDASSPEVAEERKANPNRFAPVADQHVKMLGPDGKAYTMTASSAQDAIGKGFGWLDDKNARFEARAEGYRKAHSDGAEVAAREFVNQLSMGVADVTEQHKLQAEELEGLHRAAGDHRVAQIAGGAGGALAGLAITSGLGAAKAAGTGLEAAEAAGKAAGLAEGSQALKAATPGLAQRMAAATARGAAEGALYASPQSVAQAAYGDYQQAGESLAWGIGAGGLLGLGHGAFTEAVTAGKGALAAGKAKAGAALEERGLLTPEGKIDLPKLGIATPEEAAARRAAAGASLEEHAGILDKAIGDLPGKRRLELDAMLPTGTSLSDKVGSQLADQAPGFTIGLGGERRAVVADALKTIAAKGEDQFSFGELQKLRSGLLDAAEGSVEKMRVARQVDQVIETAQSKAMADAYHALPLKADYASYLADLSAKQAAFGQAAALGSPGLAQQWMAGKMVGGVSKAVGGAVGGLVGGAIAGPAGAWMGSKAVTPLVNRILDHALTPKALELSGGALRKIANSDLAGYFGAALAKDAAGAAEAKIATIPKMLADTGARAAASNAPDVFRSWLGRQANGLSKDQQYDKVTQAITAAAANPDGTKQQLAAVNSALDHDPRLQAAHSQVQLRRIDYLAKMMPKQPEPQAFAPAPKPMIHPAEKAAFTARAQVAMNPFSVMDHVSAGSLRPEHVEALKTLYPTLHESMVAQVAAMAHDPKAGPVSMGMRQQLSMLTGVSLDNPARMNVQATYQTPQQPQGPPPKKGRGGGGKSSGSNPLSTPTQRLEFK